MAKKKFLVVLMCVMMVFSIISVPAMADSVNVQKSETVSAKITVKGTSLVSLNRKPTKMTVKWKKQTEKISGKRISGYQVQIATDKNFTKNRQSVKIKDYKTTSKTFKNLKKYKTYYARVRTYFKSGTNTIYSKWSKVKSAKGKQKQPPTPTPVPGPTIVLNDNDIKLADQIYERYGVNSITSPTSINMVLAMLLAGAEGSTKEELENYLGIMKDELPSYVSSLLQGAYDGEGSIVTINNAFWYQTDQPVKQEYMDTLWNIFQLNNLSDIDFADTKNAADAINSWCDETTNGLIKEIVTEQMLVDVKDVLVNTVYFKNAWADPINEYAIQQGEFKGIDQSYNVDYLHSDEQIAYENDQARAFEKRFENGKYAFIGIEPKAEGDSFTLESLDIESLLKNRYVDYDHVYVTMPKFDLESGGDLTEILQDLGIRNSFSPGANFSGITDEELLVSDVVHKTKMILDEKGVEAAAATAAAAKDSAYPHAEMNFYVELTHPFAFLILDLETGNILFMGKITNPAAAG